MDQEQLAIKLQETTDRSLRNEGRIKKLETEQSTIHQLAQSVAVMAEQLKTMNASVNKLTSKVDVLESEPAKRWRFVVEKSIYFAVGAVIAYVFAQIGL